MTVGARASGVRAVLGVGPAVGYTLGLFVIGAIPVAPSPPGSLGDKWLHAVCFAAYVPVLQLAHRSLWPGHAVVPTSWRLAATSSGVGLALEFWQLLWPTRTFELLDWAADSAGAASAALLSHALWATWARWSSRRAA